jgi:hypothetical protein
MCVAFDLWVEGMKVSESLVGNAQAGGSAMQFKQSRKGSGSR